MADRIRVLLIAPSLDILGGQAVQATRLIEGLSRDGVTVDFQAINPAFPGPLKWVKKVPFLRTALTFSLYISQILVRTRRYDILHVFSAGLTSFTLWTIPAVLIGRKLYGVKFILNYRDGQVEQHVRDWKSALPVIRAADVVISPSDYVVGILKQYGVKASAIFNVIDFSRFRYRQRSKLRPVFMTNRILEPIYNVGCILRAFAIVQKRYPDASLTIGPRRRFAAPVGGAGRRSWGLARIRNSSAGCRILACRRCQANEADIYMTSPDFDCMPGSLLECYASGLPVIATSSGWDSVHFARWRDGIAGRMQRSRGDGG